MKKQAGFTLIELVVVIVILGILAATAVPKFVDLSGEAETAATQAAAAAVTSAGNLNYAKRKANSTNGIAIEDGTDACAGAAKSVFAGQTSLLTGSTSLITSSSGQTSSQYVIAAVSGACSSGATVTCSLTSKGGKTANASVPCTN